MSVAVGGLDLEDAAINGQECDIECAAAKVKDEDVPLLPFLDLVQPVRNGGSGGLIDDAQNIESGNGASILGGLTL
ncbi:MAG: hypothetical protein JW395_2157 [Nitrospira sp.]|nr:hypothetical protein [Nitrospira sp.]